MVQTLEQFLVVPISKAVQRQQDRCPWLIFLLTGYLRLRYVVLHVFKHSLVDCALCIYLHILTPNDSVLSLVHFLWVYIFHELVVALVVLDPCLVALLCFKLLVLLE